MSPPMRTPANAPHRSHPLAAAATLALAALAAAAPVAAEDLEDALRARWLGAWVVTKVETYSDCDSMYANNDINGTRVASRAGLGFAVGELAHVDKVNVKSSRVDVYITVTAPLRTPHQEGPFTLFDERTCKIQLLIDAAGKDIRAGNLEPVDAAIAQALEKFATRAEAEVSPAWNRRALEPLPADYPETLARYQAWKVEQVNAQLAAVREEAIDEAARVAQHVDDDPGYLAGFAKGTEEARYWSPGSCESIASASFAGFERREPKDHRGDEPAHRSWRRGYHDGQVLAYNLVLARAVKGCFLPPPPHRRAEGRPRSDDRPTSPCCRHCEPRPASRRTGRSNLHAQVTAPP